MKKTTLSATQGDSAHIGIDCHATAKVDIAMENNTAEIILKRLDNFPSDIPQSAREEINSFLEDKKEQLIDFFFTTLEKLADNTLDLNWPEIINETIKICTSF